MASSSVAPSTKFGAIPLDPSFKGNQGSPWTPPFIFYTGIKRFVTRFMRGLLHGLCAVCHKVYARFVTRFIRGLSMAFFCYVLMVCK